MFERELPGAGIEVEELSVAAPRGGNVEVRSNLVRGELTPQQIEEDAFTERPILGRPKASEDGPDQRRSIFGLAGEDSLGALDVTADESAPLFGYLHISA